ncbi:restriction endonuclease subunit S, partial [Vibrio cholerae]
LVYIDEDAAKKLSNVIVEENDVLLNITGDSVARVCLAKSRFLPARVNQHVAIIRPDNDEFDPRFIRYLLASPTYQNILLSIAAVGATRNALTKGMIENLDVLKPPIEQQIEMANQLEALDKKIDINSETNQTLEQIAQAIFKSWFVDFDPVKAKIETLAAGGSADDAELAAMRVISAKTLDQLNSLKASNPEAFNKLAQTAALFPAAMQDSELGEIPEGWDVLSLQESFKVVMGQSPKGDTYNEAGEGTLFYQGRAEFGWRFPTPRLYTTDPKRMACKGDVLMSVRAPVGDLNIAMNDCCVGRGLCSLLHKSGSTSFTYYLLKSLQNKLDSFNGEGTVFGSINQKDLKAIRYISASDEVISSFVELVGNNDKKIEVLSLESLSLVALRDALLPKLLSGEIDLTSDANE